MAQDTTEKLINLVKEQETIPDSGAAYSEDVLLNYLDYALKGFIVPAIETTMEEHFVVTRDFQMPQQPPYNGVNPPTDVGNVIDIPGVSTGLRLRDVYLIGVDGSFYNLPRLTPSQAAAQSFGSVNWGPGFNNQVQGFGGFYLQGNQVQIFPYGLASGKTVRITFQRAPADLCLTSDAGKITNISGNVVTIDKILTDWKGTTQVGVNLATHLNAISGIAPYEYVRDSSVPVTVYTSYTPLDDIVPLTVVSNQITFNPGVTTNMVIGDWICPSGQSVFAQNIPRELLPALCRKAGEMCLEAAGDREGQRVANETFVAMMQMALLQIAPRVIGKPIKILPTNSAFRASRAWVIGRR